MEGVAELVRKALGGGDGSRRCSGVAHKLFFHRGGIVAVADRALEVCRNTCVIGPVTCARNRTDIIAVTDLARLTILAGTDRANTGSVILATDRAGIIAVFDGNLGVSGIAKDTGCASGASHIRQIRTVRNRQSSGIDSAGNAASPIRHTGFCCSHAAGERASVDRDIALCPANNAANVRTVGRVNVSRNLQVLDGGTMNRSEKADAAFRSQVHRQALDGVVRAVKCAGICL